MVAIECFTWTTVVVRALCRVIGIGWRDEDIVVVDLPDDCIIEILCRLPSHDVLRCRRVCKRWHSLTSSAHFIEYQSSKAPSIVLGQLVGRQEHHPTINYFCLDGNQSKKLKKLQLNVKPSIWFTPYLPQRLYSFGGLLAFQSFSGRSCIVLNPISGESRAILAPVNRHGQVYHGYMCGLFFHPSACEYKLLFAHVGAEGNFHRYDVYRSTTNTWREIKTFPFQFRPPYRRDPVIVNMSLHWIVNYRRTEMRSQKVSPPFRHAVMVFNIHSEKMFFFPLPQVLSTASYYTVVNNGLTLFEMDKHLCCSHMTRCDENASMMTIWELNDYENCSWVIRHNIRYYERERRYLCDYSTRQEYMMKIVCVKKGILLICWNASGLQLLNLATYESQTLHDRHISSDPGRFYLFDTYKCSLLVPKL